MVNSISLYAQAKTISAAIKNTTSTGAATEKTSNQNTIGTLNRSSVTISSLANQLAASADRAEKRDKTLSRSELAEEAQTRLSQLQGDIYTANKTQYDDETPRTEDPTLLARAKQATAFVNNTTSIGHTEANPFVGLSREQLSHIIYDNSGTFTINERKAALIEANKQEETWKTSVSNQARDEYNSTGQLTNFYNNVLEHFKSLPAIDQARYPENFAGHLASKISHSTIGQALQTGNGSAENTTLMDMLFSDSPLNSSNGVLFGDGTVG